MRVIAGTAKRLQLKTLDGLDTRPTTDRIKETLFNMISPSLYDCVFLDLFSGSGGIGIEALSRGAREAVFVENNPRAMNCIRENLKHTGLEEKAVLFRENAADALRKMEGRPPFDYIFMDPPYNRDLEKEVLSYLAKSNLVSSDTVLIIEAAIQTDFSYIGEFGFSLLKEKNYKTNKHVFLERGKKEALC